MIGTICYDCHSGLGHLARDFWKYGILDRALVVKHPRYQSYNWYPDGVGFSIRRAGPFLDGLKTLLIFETAVGNQWSLVRKAKRQGTKIVVIPMYEYTPFPLPVEPDIVLCPSWLDFEIYKDRYKCEFIPIPVAKPWKFRETAVTFVHNAGHGQHGFAKGTPQLIEAMEHVKAPIRLIIRGQPGEPRIEELFRRHATNDKIILTYGDVPEEELYSLGDVFINAEQFNGLSLPLQEAYASGMMVMTTDRYPTNLWLPKEPLIPAERYEEYQIAVKFERAVINPMTIAERIDHWYGKDISRFSNMGREWAELNSWSLLKPRYLSLLEK